MSTDAVTALRSALSQPLAAVETHIAACTQHPLALISGPAAHLLGAGGKRLRPLLTLTFAALSGGNSAADAHLAAAVELLHAATLLHDDVIDGSSLRRGRDTANALWGNKVSILVGDFLFACAFGHMTDAGSAEALQVLSAAARDIVAGELLQLSLAGSVPAVDAYFQVVHAKTAILFAAAAQSGAIVAGADAAQSAAARNFGLNFGTAFQIVDDVLDYTGTDLALGKPAGNDVREGKLTLPALLAYEAGDDVARAFWQDAARNGGDPIQAMALLQQCDALETALQQARGYAAAADADLRAFPDQHPLRMVLAELLQQCCRRTF